MADKPSDPAGTLLSEVCRSVERIAPLGLAQKGDNVGLLAGDPGAIVRRALLCVDLTADVAAEAIRQRADLVVAYHPPLFKPISRLNAASRDTDAHVFACIANGIAVYSPHTALDAAEGGTNDVLASLCNVKNPQPVELADELGEGPCKVVVFVPAAEVDAVAEAMFAAGAGRIGEYDKCSFRVAGQGTFLGSDQTKPTIGQAGAFERVDEIRLEAVVPAGRVGDVVRAIRAAHSYEEPAFDIYSLHKCPAKGIGRQGLLDPPVQLGALAANVKCSLQASCVQVVGDTHGTVKRAICMAGAVGGRMFQAGLGPGDVVVTGEIRHHDALAILRHGACAIAVNHWTSERPALKALAERLSVEVPGVKTALSAADREPFSAA